MFLCALQVVYNRRMCVDGCMLYLCIYTRKILNALTLLPSVLLTRACSIEAGKLQDQESIVCRVNLQSQSPKIKTELEMRSFKESQFGRLRSTRGSRLCAVGCV